MPKVKPKKHTKAREGYLVKEDMHFKYSFSFDSTGEVIRVHADELYKRRKDHNKYLDNIHFELIGEAENIKGMNNLIS